MSTATQVKEWGRLFVDEMVRAILSGAKTQTRWPVKWRLRPGEEGLNLGFSGLEAGHYFTDMPESGWVLRSRGAGGCWNDRTYPAKCPLPGDRLWVREAWGEMWWSCIIGQPQPARKEIVYRAGPHPFGRDVPHGWTVGKDKWRPNIHMPRRATRIVRDVVCGRIERLQSITEDDAIAEGVDAVSLADVPRQATWSRRQDFAQLWNRLYTKSGFRWEDNPWVRAVEFERMKGEGS